MVWCSNSPSSVTPWVLCSCCLDCVIISDDISCSIVLSSLAVSDWFEREGGSVALRTSPGSLLLFWTGVCPAIIHNMNSHCAGQTVIHVLCSMRGNPQTLQHASSIDLTLNKQHAGIYSSYGIRVRFSEGGSASGTVAYSCMYFLTTSARSQRPILRKCSLNLAQLRGENRP